MGGDLDRDLGLLTLVMISVGAMIGPGLFVLPGLAAEMAGPAVVLAYVIAGLVALPAALSKAELATAMPDSGGPYLYMDRSMGPLVGTVTGLGAWLSLLFKAAFALVGLGVYLSFFVELGAGMVELVALGAAAGLVLSNVLGAKETGTLQTVIVAGVLVVLAAFTALATPRMDPASLTPFSPHGSKGLLAAAGFVFVSFIGIMKIASIAEEAEDPDKNLPRALMISLGIVLVLYPILMVLVVGLVPMDELSHSLAPMADAAAGAGGTWLVGAVSAAAVAALASMANASILAASRIPFALSRDDLAPSWLTSVPERFGTPAAAILLSGGLLATLVATLPVHALAELASAFLILVFGAMNAAVMVLREGEAEWYDPAFVSPGYPWVQIAGIGGGLVLLTQMGLVPMLGAIGLVTGGLAWYFAYAHRRTAREGVAVDVLRRRWGQRSLEDAEAWLAAEGHTVLVAAQPSHPERMDALLDVGGSIAGGRRGRLIAVGLPADPSGPRQGPSPDELSALLATRPDEHRPPIEVPDVAGQEPYRELAEAAARLEADVILIDGKHAPTRLDELESLADDLPCDFVRCWPATRRTVPQDVHVVSQRGGFDPMKVRIASDVSRSTGADLSFLHAVPANASDAQLASLRHYHESLAELCDLPAKSKVLRSDEPLQAITEAARRADVLIVGDASGVDLDALVEEADEARTVMTVHPVADRRPSRLERFRERVLYRT